MAAIQGDWFASRSTHDGEAYLQGDGKVRFVYATQPSGEKYIVAKVWADEGDYEGTARLVAAAPDLLAVCQEILQFMVPDDDDTGPATRLRMAVSKATGEDE